MQTAKCNSGRRGTISREVHSNEAAQREWLGIWWEQSQNHICFWISGFINKSKAKTWSKCAAIITLCLKCKYIISTIYNRLTLRSRKEPLSVSINSSMWLIPQHQKLLQVIKTLQLSESSRTQLKVLHQSRLCLHTAVHCVYWQSASDIRRQQNKHISVHNSLVGYKLKFSAHSRLKHHFCSSFFPRIIPFPLNKMFMFDYEKVHHTNQRSQNARHSFP